MDNILKYFGRVGTSLSILLNVILGGYSNQTFSARNYDRKRNDKINVVWFIDTVFREKDHCLKSWTYWILRKEIDK